MPCKLSTETNLKAAPSGAVSPLADSTKLARYGETARSSQGGRQADFLATLGIADLPVINALGDGLGSSAKWLQDFQNRLDFIRVAKPLVAGRRLHHLENVEDSTRRLIRQLGEHPWEVSACA